MKPTQELGISVALVALHALLLPVLADRDLVASALSPGAHSQAGALLVAGCFLATRIAVLVVLPVYWCGIGVLGLLRRL